MTPIGFDNGPGDDAMSDDEDAAASEAAAAGTAGGKGAAAKPGTASATKASNEGRSTLGPPEIRNSRGKHVPMPAGFDAKRLQFASRLLQKKDKRKYGRVATGGGVSY